MVFHLKPRTFFWIRIFSRSPDTQLCSNDSKHTLRINFRFSFKRKEKAWKALIWQTLRKQVFCGVNILIYFTIQSQTFRKGTEKRKGAIPIKSNRVVLIHSWYEKGWRGLLCSAAPLQSFKVFGNKTCLFRLRRTGACFSLSTDRAFCYPPPRSSLLCCAWRCVSAVRRAAVSRLQSLPSSTREPPCTDTRSALPVVLMSSSPFSAVDHGGQ